jgi:hypothetical protein
VNQTLVREAGPLIAARRETTAERPYRDWRVLAALAVLAVLPYLRSLGLPLITDDHLQVLLSRQWGPPSGWASLMHDALYRSRATSLLVTHWTELAVGFSPIAFHLTSLALHIFNTWLVLLLGSWPAIGWRRAALAAGFFAVYEGHQEAVIWYAALPELLVFAFGMASFLCWVAWLESDRSKTRWLLASFAAFVLSLFSKESAVLVVPMMALPLAFRREKLLNAALALLPFAALAALYFAAIDAAAAGHQHFHDGTFDLAAPFLRTIAISTARQYWFWGLLGTAALLLAGAKARFRILALGLAWSSIAFLPYSFLTYMKFVPSRHTYFASVGVALVVAAGFLALFQRWGRLDPARVAAPRRWLMPMVLALVILHNSAYVWIWKHRQYMERAAPVLAVIQAARATGGPVYVHCFPFPLNAADAASTVEAGRPPGTVRQWQQGSQPDPPPARILCLDPRSHGPHPSQAFRLMLSSDGSGALVPPTVAATASARAASAQGRPYVTTAQ